MRLVLNLSHCWFCLDMERHYGDMHFHSIHIHVYSYMDINIGILCIYIKYNLSYIQITHKFCAQMPFKTQIFLILFCPSLFFNS